MYQLLERHAHFAGEASYQGRLYRIDWYPGVIPSDDPKRRVKGEVYVLPQPELVLPQLDKYEECGPGFPAPTEYVREEKEVILNNGRKLIAWIYIYNRPVAGCEEIATGDFLSPKDV
ncbi:MAG: gamma-glutamylcyclotransferase [Burkholderiales bacterium]|nr:gamma-glutamylcyclotransferase [Burkholderiales bacterium]